MSLLYIFNRVSKSRVKEVGPDRACAEWLMRNGAFVRWKNQGSLITHYDNLPLDSENKGIYLLEEIDATNAAISHHGFNHFKGCNHVNTIKFINCIHVNDKALQKMHFLKGSLNDLLITQCPEVTDAGLVFLGVLLNLKKLQIGQLKNVTNIERSAETLRKHIPTCDIVIQ